MIYAEFYKNIKNKIDVPLPLLVYETFMNKYGMKKIAEKKLYEFYLRIKQLNYI